MNKKTRRRILIWLLILIAVVIGIFATCPNYIIQIVDKYNEKNELKHQLETLKEDESSLKKEVEQLKDVEYVAKIARQKYLFSKDGEMVIKVNTKNTDEDSIDKLSINFNFYNPVFIISTSLLLIIFIFKLFKKKKKKRTRHN